MLGALTTLTAIVALAVSAAPVALAHSIGAGKDRGWFTAAAGPPRSGASGFAKVVDLDGTFTGLKPKPSGILSMDHQI
jgi:hypothetical protein